jgi:hypothetical protein
LSAGWNRSLWCLGLAALCGLTAAGCAAVLVGAGAGAGAYTYVQGEVVRAYPARYAHTLAVCTRIFQDLEITLRQRDTDGTQTVLSAERRDGTPMTVRIRISGLEVTEVAVRTGRVGYWNHDLSRKFHDFIEQRLKAPAGAVEVPG